MHERAGALEVRQELVAEPHALARALDQARDVGDDQLAPVGRLDRAEHRLQRRERIVGHLRPRVRDARERATTCPRSAARRAPRRRAASGAARCRARRPAGRPRRSGAPAASSETKRALPRPPCPPRASTTRAPGCARSAISSPSSASTCVPTGTASSASSPRAPCLRAPRPFSPRPARILCRRAYEERSRSDVLATSTMSPPSPPSPPSGPPFGTYFSRRKLRPPSPPLPAAM